jgi:soluble lytic murein transglycosylase
VKRVWLAGSLLALVVFDIAILRWWFQNRREKNADRVILVAAGRYGLSPALVKAVVWRESRFDSKARGQAGEIGLMQVGKAAAQEWAQSERVRFFEHSDLFDPQKNALAGTYYLQKARQRYLKTDNPLPYALAEYNAGRTHVLRWSTGAAVTNSAAFLSQVDYPTTRDYIESVLERYEYYRTRFPSKRAKAGEADVSRND